MSNETNVTIRGFVGGSPTTFTNTYNAETGEQYARDTTVFRIGVTPSYYSRDEEKFKDGQTVWYSVRTYGALATNVANCVRIGMPLLVRGRLTVRNYTDRNEQLRQENVVIADSVGVELSNGTVTYAKRSTASLDSVSGEPQQWNRDEDSGAMGESDEAEYEDLDEQANYEDDSAREDPAGVLVNAEGV